MYFFECINQFELLRTHRYLIPIDTQNLRVSNSNEDEEEDENKMMTSSNHMEKVGQVQVNCSIKLLKEVSADYSTEVPL